MRFLMVVVTAVLAVVPAARAAQIDVTTPVDAVEDSGTCSLREAVQAAEADMASGATPGECPAGEAGATDVIGLPAGILRLDLGVLDVSGDSRIHGAPDGLSTIEGTSGGRVLHVHPGARLALAGLDLTGGGVLNAGELTIVDSGLYGNSATFGGAVASSGALRISGSTLTANAAPGGAGGAVGISGGTAVLDGLTLSGNQAAEGGAVATTGGSLQITATVFQGGRADRGAELAGSGTVSVTGSTFRGSHPGGIWRVSGGSAVVERSWIDYTGAGGALTVFGGALALDHVTATAAGAGALLGVDGGSAAFTGSLLDGRCEGPATGSGNVATAGSGCPGEQARPLALTGLVPTVHSPAVDAAGACSGMDLRGVSRPQGAACDAGAVERRATVVALEAGPFTFIDTPVGLRRTGRTVQARIVEGEADALLSATASGEFGVSDCTARRGCDLSLSFAPTARGVHRGALIVRADDPGAPSLQRVLTGRATGRRAVLRAGARRKRRGRVTVRGRLTYTAPLHAARACTGSVRAKGRRARVRRDCTFTLRLRRARAVRLRFGGNEVLRAASKRVRVRR